MKIPFSHTIKNYLQERQYRSNGWAFSDVRRHMYIFESADWEKYYLPIDVAGKTVLDVGAGEGETARFFLEHGAAKVICVEPDEQAFRILAYNSRHKKIECYQLRFKLSLLDAFEWDLAKIDIEGYEEALLKLSGPLQKPYAIEVHGLQLIEKFVKKGYAMSFPNGSRWIGYTVSSSSRCI